MADGPEDLDARVDALRKAGRYAEAAQLCLQVGDVARAASLYAAVWDWPRAIEVAEQGGRYDLAYEHALAGQDRVALARILAILPDFPEQSLTAAAAAEVKGRTVDAARLREAAGHVEEAAALYERAGELFEAARCFEAAGRYREAGMLYERRLREDSMDADAGLRLGRILAHFGRFDHAVRALQSAAREEDRAPEALPLLVACFAALGMDEAAATCLEQLRRHDRTVPQFVAEYLQDEYGDDRGIAGLVREGDAAQLLAGRYRLLSPLGSGGTGRVLLAHDGFYDREVAVKILQVGSGTGGRDAYVRFAREARVAAGLEHPNVVRVFEFNADGPFLVMEYMPGGTLEDRLLEVEGAGVRLPLGVTEHVARAIVRGLEAVHRRGVIHRDLKPANVFFGATGDVKLGDFGVAHLADLGATLTGAMLGTLAYMAPEQITGSQRPDASTDLYAFGVMLFRMFSGRLPYPGPDFVSQHLELPVPKVSAVAPMLGNRFDALIRGLLAKEPEARIRSAAELLSLLDEQDWSDPAEDRVRIAADPDAATTTRAPSTVPPAPLERYQMLAPLPDGGHLARDVALDRTVELRVCDDDTAHFFRTFARADGPFLQAVYDADPATGHAVVEHPTGQPLGRAVLDPAARARVEAQIRAAVARLHQEGVVHGAIAATKVLVSRGRAVLLLPRTPNPDADREDDIAALEVLFASCVTPPGP